MSGRLPTRRESNPPAQTPTAQPQVAPPPAAQSQAAQPQQPPPAAISPGTASGPAATVRENAIPAQPIADNTVTAIVGGSTIVNRPAVQRALDDIARRQANASPQGSRLTSLRETRDELALLAGEGYAPEPNILDSFANYTYHIRLSMTNDIDASALDTSENFDAVAKVVVAESGATAGFNITEFEIENMCSPGPRVRSMTHTKWKMSIKEPFGLSLIDRIFEISQEMGISNHLTAPYFIEVWFTGYDEDGTIASTDMKEVIYRLFRVNITKLMSDTSSSGTDYQLEGVFDGSFGNNDHVAIPANGVNIASAETVGDFFNKLSAELTRQQGQLQMDNRARMEYQFNMPQQMRAWRLTQRPSASQRNSDFRVTGFANGTSRPTVSIARGMDISTILYFVVSMTTEGRRFMAGDEANVGPAQNQGRAAAQRQNSPSLRDNGLANIFSIHSAVRLIGYDFLINDYVRRVIYTFSYYPTTRAIVDIATVRQTLQDNNQFNRAQALLGSRRYVKAYEYIYTGRNLDILRFDIKLELTWQAAIPMQLGENTYLNYTVGPTQDPSGVALDVLSQYNQTQARLAQSRAELEAVRRDSPRNRAEISRLERQITQEEASLRRLREANSFVVLWDDSSTGQRATNNIQALRRLQVSNTTILDNPAVAANLASRLRWEQFAREQNDRPLAQRRRQLYLEDIKVLPVSRPQRIPLSFRPNPGPTNQTTTGGGESAPDQGSARRGAQDPVRGRGLVGTILNDVMSAPYLTTIELEIRGDPYWLGLGNVNENYVLRNSTTAPDQTMAAWFLHGETGFTLSFRTGEAPDEQTGYMKFTESSVAFSGLYGVIKVKSSFKDGRFTQTLEAVRDSLLELERIRTEASRDLTIANRRARGPDQSDAESNLNLDYQRYPTTGRPPQ